MAWDAVHLAWGFWHSSVERQLFFSYESAGQTPWADIPENSFSFIKMSSSVRVRSNPELFSWRWLTSHLFRWGRGNRKIRGGWVSCGPPLSGLGSGL